VVVNGEMNIGPYGPYRETRDDGFFVMNKMSGLGANEPQLLVSSTGTIWVYGNFDASAVPAKNITNNGYIWAWDTGWDDDVRIRGAVPNGTAQINYDVLIDLGSNTVNSSWTVGDTAGHTQDFVLMLTHEYGYAIYIMEITLRGNSLVEGVDYEFDRHKLTVFASALDGATGLLYIKIGDAFQPSPVDLMIQIGLLGSVLLLIPLFLLLAKRRKKKEKQVPKRYY